MERIAPVLRPGVHHPVELFGGIGKADHRQRPSGTPIVQVCPRQASPLAPTVFRNSLFEMRA
jgi:hypothetical protein